MLAALGIPGNLLCYRRSARCGINPFGKLSGLVCAILVELGFLKQALCN